MMLGWILIRNICVKEDDGNEYKEGGADQVANEPAKYILCLRPVIINEC